MESTSPDYPKRSAEELLLNFEDLTLDKMQRLDLTDTKVAAEFLRLYGGGRRAPGDRDQRITQPPGHIANMGGNPDFDQDHSAELED